MRFRYQAKTQTGELQNGYVEAGNREAATNILASHNLFVLGIESVDKENFFDRLTNSISRVRRKDMIVFTRQLAMLLEAKLPIANTLRTLHAQTKQPLLRAAILRVSEDIDSGIALSQALERQGGIFSGFFISMIRAAETTGNLSEAALFLADYTEKEGNLASKALGAMIYPAVIMGLFGAVAIVLVVVVFPQLKPIFESAGVTLPWYTKLLLGSGDFLAKWWFMVLGVIGALVAIVMNYTQTTEGRGFFDDLKVQMPLVRGIYIPLTMSRFSNALAMLLKGGIPVAQALEIVGHTVGNTLYEDILHEASNTVRQGESLSEALGRYPDYFPALVPQMLVVGESTGRLDEILIRVSSYYTRETDLKLDKMVDLLQPLMLIFIGVMVGGLFGAILVPLYNLTSNVR